MEFCSPVGPRLLRERLHPGVPQGAPPRIDNALNIMSSEQPNNPLHGLTLEVILTRLVEYYGWEEMARRININCFKSDPSVKSSLKFLRKTQWARDKVEGLYISTFEKQWPWGNAK